MPSASGQALSSCPPATSPSVRRAASPPQRGSLPATALPPEGRTRAVISTADRPAGGTRKPPSPSWAVQFRAEALPVLDVPVGTRSYETVIEAVLLLVFSVTVPSTNDRL